MHQTDLSKMAIQSLAIFCGSKTGKNNLFMEQATELGKLLAKNNVTIIYGGGKKGLMGCIADTALEYGGIVKGVIPQILVDWEHQHDMLTQLLIVEDMHQRKRKLYELCDAAIILPGGFGTLDEMFEIITWNQLSIHDKKIFVLNTDGFYNHLLAHLRLLKEEEFLYTELDDCITVLNQPKDIVAHLI
jgi:uncharacterized protein (TIGR00730 family)